MTETKDEDDVVRKFDDKLHKLIKRAESSTACYGPRSLPNSSLLGPT